MGNANFVCACAGGVITFVGDSITERYDWNDYGDRYSSVNNKGFSGMGTVKIIEELANIKATSPNVVVLLIGINDIRKPESITIEQSLSNYQYILNELDGYNVFCVSILPVEDQGNGYNDDVLYYNTQIKAMHNRYIDAHKVFMAQDDYMDFLVDDVHPNQDGYDLMIDVYRGYF